MDARLIQFHISPQVKPATDDKNSTTPQNGFNLEFVAKNKYISEDMRGVPQFRRELRHKMQHIVDQFNEYYQWNIDKTAEMEGNVENFGALENLNDSAKYLVSLLKNDFLVPNELELTAIHLVGDFNVYYPGNNTELKKNATKIREQSIQQFRTHQQPQPMPGPMMMNPR
ncbi:hypothetical protein [uncultured Limosilactobacillus sp.]|uniref:hypothetical protein n=1 Tax=uncultured Limosilactobacillus sp. TaxID=2837629 RepID=UPI0025E50248|nr:hypothetical protein [uncultured Limosilactobacillus sp.]